MNIKLTNNKRYIFPALISIIWLTFPLYKTPFIGFIPLICTENFIRLLLLNLLLLSFTLSEKFSLKDSKKILYCILSFSGMVLIMVSSYIYSNCTLVEFAYGIPLVFLFILFRNRVES